MRTRSIPSTAGARRVVFVGAAFLAAASLQMTGCGRSKPSVALAPLFNENAPNKIPDHYLVIFKNDTPQNSIDAAKSLAQSLGGTVGFTYTTAVKGFSARLPAAALGAIRAVTTVAHVEADKTQSYETSLTQPPNPAATPAPGLDRIDQRLLPLSQTYSYSETGTGVNVYVIDSGIRITHSEFGGRARAAFSVSSNFDDCRGHGTHVAAIIGGETFGVAKAVTLHSVKIGNPLDCTPSDANIIAGIDWVVANRVLPAVANLSVGGPPVSPTLDTAVAAAVASGITFVIAAGNFGDNACNSSPGRVPAAITVGAVDPRNDTRWVSSNIGTCIDVFAPGVDILSAWNGSDVATDTKSGTSQAAPFVTGAVARFLQTTPAATPADVWAALHRVNNVSTTTGWRGVVDPGNGSPNELLNVHTDTVIIPASDSTPPTGITIEIDRPNAPRLTATESSADPPANGVQGQTIRVTARADDLDGGLQDIQIWMTEQIWTNGVTQGPGLAGLPVAADPRSGMPGQSARTTGSVTYSFTLPTISANQNRQYVFLARAENFSGGVKSSLSLVINLP
jgi:subtilisin family serine protease